MITPRPSNVPWLSTDTTGARPTLPRLVIAAALALLAASAAGCGGGEPDYPGMLPVADNQEELVDDVSTKTEEPCTYLYATTWYGACVGGSKPSVRTEYFNCPRRGLFRQTTIGSIPCSNNPPQTP